MLFSELISRINNLASDDEVALYFKALRQNSIIWDEFKDLCSEDNRVLALSRQKQLLNAGTLAIVSFDINFKFDTLVGNRFSPGLLEKVMLGYEEYLLTDSSISSMDQIGQIALALIAKQSDAGNWKDVVDEIVTRKKVKDNKEFERLWIPVFIAIINLVNDRDGFLRQILTADRLELILSSVAQMVLALPVSEAEKSNLLQEQLFPLDEQAQLNVLRILNHSGGSEIAAAIAVYLLEKYHDLDLSSRSTRDYWKDPVESTRLAFQCQAVADIAQIAGEDATALELNEKALAILTALVKKGKVKKAGISNRERFQFSDIFSGEELHDPDIQAELIYSQDLEDVNLDGLVHPVNAIRQSKILAEAGHPELAKEEIQATLAGLSDGELELFLVKGPNQIQNWEPEEFIQSLMDMGAYEAVNRVSSILLNENPTNVTVNQAAAKSAEMLGNSHKAANNYETLALLQPESIDTKRKLAQIYIADEQPDNALRMYQELIEKQEMPDEKDLLALAELALRQEKFKEAKEAASKILELNPENAQALTLMGTAHRLLGNIEASEKYLRNAISFTAGDNRPWLELAELQWSTDKHTDAIITLQEGIAAIPNEIGIKTVLAKKLMSDGRVSEAYPLLTDLSSHGADLESDLLLVDAMDILGIEGVEELLEVLIERYPDDNRFLGDYGQRLVWSGEIAKGLGLLERLGGEINSNNEWKLAQVEAKWQPDFSNLVFDRKPSMRESKEILTLVDEYLSEKPDNRNAALLKAETLLNTGEYRAAFEILKDLNRENIANQVIDQARLTADISIAAAGCGELEIAKAALEKAISLQPGWHGLKAVKVRFLHETGEDAGAVQLVKKALEEVPQSAENQSWAIHFLHQIGQVEAASKLLDDSMQRYPEDLGLNLLKAEISLSGTRPEADLNTDELFEVLQQNVAPDELIRAAAVYAELEDHERTIWCLQEAIDAGSEEAVYYLAGLHRINKDYSLTRRTLETIGDQSDLVSLLIFETQSASGGVEQPQLPQIEVDSLPLDFEFREEFLPGEWKELLQSSRPAISLVVKMAMQNGDFKVATEAVRNWIIDEPNNVEARVFGIELALASGDREWYEQLTSAKFDVHSESFSNQLHLLIIENQYERGMEVDTPIEDYGLFETINVDEPDQLSIIREQRLAGRITEAETTFEMAIGVYSNLVGIPFISKLGILRNLVKSAILLNRWSDAIEYVNRVIKLAPTNDMVNVLRLQAAAKALEFENQVQLLSVTAHGAFAIRDYATGLLQQPTADSESDSKSADFRHWLIRLTLAHKPSKENIHKLAQLTPGADDAAAMMAGLRATGQADTALRIGRKFAENPDVMNGIALCLREEQPEEAIKWLRKSLEKDPYQPIALRMLSCLFVDREELSEAVVSLESALELWPNESAWHIAAAELWQKQGNTEKPLEHLQIASLYDPKDVDIHRLLGGAFLASGRMTDALPHLTTVVEKDPQDYDTWNALSELYQSTGDLDLAQHSAERATELNPSGVKARLQTARVYWKKGNLKQALEQAKQAIGLDPHDPANYVFMARLAKEQGDTTEALELLEKAEKVTPAPLQTVIEHANLIKEINGVIAARDLIASFSRKFPENPDLLVLLADAEEQCGDARSAETAAQKALDIKPGEKDILMLLGRIVEKNGNLDRAAHYYSQAVSLEPELTEGYLNLSKIYIRQREFGKARKVLEQGIEQVSGNVALYLSCAALLKESKDYRGAEQMLRKASTIEPRNVSIHRQLGAILALNMVHQSQEVGSQV